MDQSDNEYQQEEEVDGVPMAAVEIEILEDIPDNPESLSPVPSSPAASPGPAFHMEPLGCISGEEAFGGAELKVFSSGGVAHLQEWAEFVRGVRGQIGFTWVVPPISERFATFLQALYGTSGRIGYCLRLEKLFLQSCGLRWWATIAKLPSQPAQFLRLMSARTV